MKLERVVSCVWGFVLSFCLSLAATACMISAFRMGVDMKTLVLCCLGASALCSVCYSLPLGLVPVGTGAVVLGYLWRSGTLEQSVEALLNRLSRQYDRAYGWGIIRWGVRTADDMEPTMITVLCILAAVIAMAVAWSVCRKRSVLPGIFLSLLCVATCFVVTDTVPATPWLYFLLLPLVLLLLTGKVRRQDEQQGNRLCLITLPVTALALLVLFAAIPRESYHGQEKAERLVSTILGSDPVQLIMGYTEGNSAIIISSDAVDLRTVGYRVESPAKILEVTAEFDGTVYLRGRAMDTYNGVSWSDSGNAAIRQLNWPNYQLDYAGQVAVSTRYAHRMLYTPYYLDISQMQEITTGIENEKKLTQYSFSCNTLSDPAYLSRLNPSPNSYNGDYSRENLARCIQLDEDVASWAVPLANKLVGDIPNFYHKANTIAAYVRNSASYDTATPRMPVRDRDFARWFLEESDTGYCVHFATATAVLLQAAGIPARYVTGYTAQVTAGQKVEVKAEQAHAWVEYFQPGFGWTVLDATPADLRRDPEQTETASVPPSTALEVDAPTLPDSSAPVQTKPQTPGKQTAPEAVLAVLGWIVGLALLVAAAEGQRALRRWLRQRRYDRAGVNDRAVLHWQETVLLARLLGQTPDKELFELAQKAKFSQHTLSEGELARFDAYADAACEQLKKRSVFHRLYYRLILAVY